MITFKLMVTGLTVAALAACGGGGGGGANTPTPTTATVTCPSGTSKTAATADQANALCPAPKLVSVAPTDAVTNVSPDSFAGVTVVTDSTLDPASLTTANVTLKVGSTTSILGTVAATDGKGFKWTPTAKLAYGQKYDFSATVKDTLGKSLAVAGSFTTATITCTAPQVPDSTGTTCAAPKAKGLALVAGDTINSPGTRDGPRLEATIYRALAIDSDEQGNVYLADGYGFFDPSFALYRKISINGTVSTLAGSKKSVVPEGNYVDSYEKITGLTVHPNGKLYANKMWYNKVVEATPQGQVSTIVGANTLPGLRASAIDGPASVAVFDFGLIGIAADPLGNLYVAERESHAIRKIDTQGSVSTYAGLIGSQGSADGTLLTARFNYPSAMKWDRAGNRLVVADNNGIREIANNKVTTLFNTAGCPTTNNEISDLAIARDGRIAISAHNQRCIQIFRNNTLETTLGKQWYEGDVDGTPDMARFLFPAGLTFLPNGDLIISDFGNSNIKRYSSATNTVTLFAGQRNFLYSPRDGIGASARLSQPYCAMRSPSGELWFNQIKDFAKIDANGKLTTVVTMAHRNVCLLKVNADGSFIASVDGDIRLHNADGTLQRTLVTGTSGDPFSQSAVNANGDVYFQNSQRGISKLGSDGAITTVVTSDQIGSSANRIIGLTVNKAGELIAAVENGLVKITPSGSVSTFASNVRNGKRTDGAVGDVTLGIHPSQLAGIAVGKNDDIYIISLVDNVIRRIRNGQVSIVVGTQWLNEYGLGPGPGSLYNPRFLAYDEVRNSLLILTDTALLRAELPD